MKDLALKIRKLREIHGYSQEYVAYEMGISQAAYSKKENGHTEFSLNCLQKLSSILNIDVVELLHFSVPELMQRAIQLTYQSKVAA